MRPAALVQTAAERFSEGDDSPFLACFHADAAVYREAAVSTEPVVSSRAELAAWLARVRDDHPGLTVTCTKPEEHGNGAACELIVTRDAEPTEVWRVVLAIRLQDDLIREVRAFWSRDAAAEWLDNF